MEPSFRFEHPQILWCVPVLLFLLSGFLYWAWRKRQRLIHIFVKSRLLANLTVGVSKQRQFLRSGLLVSAALLLLVALARPQYGFEWEEARQKGLDILVAMDTSKSMLAADIDPNRLKRACLAAQDLMALAKRDRLGLVAFAGTAFLQCPLTLDDEAFRQNLAALSPNIIPQGGTDLKAAIETSKKAFDTGIENLRVIILFTDGEEHENEEDAVDAAALAAAQGYRIFTVGVGTRKGELIQITDAQGQKRHIKNEAGEVVLSRLDESLLRKIARSGEGAYVHLQDASSVEMLYRSGIEPLPKREIAARPARIYHERFQWVLALAILFLLAELFIVDQKRVHRPEGPIRSATVLNQKS